MSAYTWQCQDHKRSGVDDMTLLSKVNVASIVENLKKRFSDDWIFTYIGPVLVSVNPFKQMKYFTQREIDMYQGAAQYENPPHIYALADNMYRNMTIDNESQCVIISGESGAGKTVAAKYIMNYLSHVSGGGPTTQHVKDIILQSNPLLEAFGNAKTIRNNNSSRFGKFVEILFSSGQPKGGQISNFLLEKSRVVTQNPQERNFHIFYQICSGLDKEAKGQFGIVTPEYYSYLNGHDCYEVEGTNDSSDFKETMKAMGTMGLSSLEQSDVLQVTSAIMHIGNIVFQESKSETAEILSDERLDFPSFLLEVDKECLRHKLLTRVMESKWGSKSESLDVTHNVQQAEAARDALAKALYARLFDYLVQKINKAMKVPNQERQTLFTLGILDIYGFEVFTKNGFEQFCINFVNEKLQQIFIELTLKAEQEEYVQENIVWKPIDYFDNSVVCQLIEDKKLPGIMAILDDVCASQHGVKEGADQNLKGKLRVTCKGNKYYNDSSRGFQIHHYAGVVDYDVDGFCERNKDVLNTDLIELMQTSESDFIKSLFPETVDRASKKRPITASAKIKSQANNLVNSLMSCQPHYIRCIKPNETKRSGDWEHLRVEHQVEYLGLIENIRVRRAGFAYRRPFEKFLHRYAILTTETWPSWKGNSKDGCIHIIKSVRISPSEFQMGNTKIFIKAPETLFMLEETRERKIDNYARVIQKAFQKYYNQQKIDKQKMEASDVFFNKKERRKHSLNRRFYGDYLGLEEKPAIKSLVGRRDKVEFAQTVVRYDRKFKGVKKTMRDLVVTSKGIFFVGREVEKSGPNKNIPVEIVTRRIEFSSLQKVSLSPKQDDFLVMHVANSYDMLLEVPFKTELVTILKRIKDSQKTNLIISFNNKIEFVAEKARLGSGTKRSISFLVGTSTEEVVQSGGYLNSDIIVKVFPGLPSSSRPNLTGKTKNKKSMNKTNQYSPSPSRNVVPARKAPNVPKESIKVSSSPPTLRPSRSGKQVPNQQNLANVLKSRNQSSSQKKQDKSPLDILNVPEGGQARASRQVFATSPFPAPRSRPIPGGGKPKPSIQSGNPRAKVLYDYCSKDFDEITITAGEVIEIINEDPSGWWKGKNRKGEEGLFPGSYVQKL